MSRSTTAPQPSVVSETDWKTALDDLKAKEEKHFDAYSELNAERRKLPMVEVTTPYEFETPDGTRSLVELFNGQRQLVLYHFMFAPDWDAGCPGCTGYTNGLGRVKELNARDTEFALVSRAPIEKIEAYKAKMGWDIPWYSVETRFSDEMGALPDGSDSPAINVFIRDDGGKVYRTYYTDGRAIRTTMGLAGIQNLTPGGTDDENGA